MNVQNRELSIDTIDFVESIEFPGEFKLKTEIKQEGECCTDNMKSETIIRSKFEPRESLNSGQSEIKDETTSGLQVKCIKNEIVEEVDVMNKNVKIESKDGEREMLEFVKNIEFSDDVKPEIEVKDEPREALNSGQSEIKGEPTSDLEVKDIKKEIKEFDVMNKNVKIESKDGEQAILEFVKIIEFYDDVKPKIEVKDEAREALNSSQSEIKDEPTSDLAVKDIKKEIKEFDVKNINVKIESKDGEKTMLEFVKNIEFSDDVKPKIEVKVELIEPKKEMDDEFQNGISVLEKMDNLEFNGEPFINDSLPQQNLTSTSGFENSQVDVMTQNTKKHFQCPICPTKFGKKSNLKVHITTVHEGNKPHKCLTCSATFGQKKGLKYHKSAVHDGIKPHECPICFAEFDEKYQLRKHISAVHDGIKKPYRCLICELSFSCKSKLSQHISSVHEGIKPHKCPSCEKSLSRKYHLSRHIKSVHEDKKTHK